MNNGCKDDGGDGKDSNDADIIILEDLTHSAERLHLSSPKKKLNDAREKAAYFEKEVSYIILYTSINSSPRCIWCLDRCRSVV
jgi:hypothetical protein